MSNIYTLQGIRVVTVQDTPGELTAGCKRCAFHTNDYCPAPHEERAAGVAPCTDGDHHYELADAQVAG